MSGFLHRIAAAVLAPEPRMHPYLDPLYAAPRLHNLQAPPALAEEEISLSSPGPSLFTASRLVAPIGNQPDSNQIESQTELPTRFLRQGLRSEAHLGQSPPGPVNQDEQALPSTPAQPQACNESFAAQRAVDFELNEGQRRFDTPADAAAGKAPADPGSPQAWGFAPVVSEDKWPAAPSAPSLQPPSLRLPQDRKGSARAETRQDRVLYAAPSAPAQQDDIQIHIGRIEVVAVSPPAPRPAAPSPRKGISLDEYLSRRNGRAG
jgi:hypothetical protein